MKRKNLSKAIEIDSNIQRLERKLDDLNEVKKTMDLKNANICVTITGEEHSLKFESNYGFKQAITCFIDFVIEENANETYQLTKSLGEL